MWVAPCLSREQSWLQKYSTDCTRVFQRVRRQSLSLVRKAPRIQPARFLTFLLFSECGVQRLHCRLGGLIWHLTLSFIGVCRAPLVCRGSSTAPHLNMTWWNIQLDIKYKTTNVYLLRKKRKRDMTRMWKCVEGIEKIGLNEYVILSQSSLTGYNKTQYRKKLIKDVKNSSFPDHAICNWNALPKVVCQKHS